ncbi:MAG TPA: BMP family protein [Caldimonas sp.]|jgi:basic membrane protein A|nr:BMP family protein [Caldimonas sp.]HEX4235631.1 BMP family protein [Caldimonas sp.]
MLATFSPRRHALAVCGLALAAPLLFASGSASAADPLTVGVLLPGSRSDKGWMESAYDGLVAAEKAHGDKIKVQLIENVSNADWEQAFTALAQKNQLVIGAAGQVQTAEMKVARRFPKVKFSLIGGNKTAEMPANFAGYDVKQAEIAYVAGVVAGMLSKNGAISYIGGIEVPPIVNAGTEFKNGAMSVNPKIKYFQNFTGDFDDVAKAKEATLAAIAQGADIHYHILNLGLRGMEQAAKEKGTHIIGSYTDRCGTDPLYIGYSITGIGYMLQYAIDQALAGKWQPGYKAFGLAMGPQASGMVVCNASPEVQKKIKETEQAIREGKIKTLEG